MKFRETIDKKSGITLIALIITIIVLLILAGASIAMLTGENGIITQAQKAKVTTANASELEKVKLAVTYAMMQDNNKLTTDNLKTAIKKEMNINDDTIDTCLTQTSDGWKFIADAETYIVQNDGNVYLYGDLETLKAGDYIKYDTKMQSVGDNGVIICRVLYDTDYNLSNNTNYGIQIVSSDSLEDVALGRDDFSITDATVIPQIASTDKFSEAVKFNKAVYSYNNVTATLNSVAQKYLNSDIAYSARCITSNPLDSANKTTESINYFDKKLEFEPCVRVNDFKETYLDRTDINQMNLLNITSSNKNYWTVVRYYLDFSERILFGTYYMDSSTSKMQYKHFCYIDESWLTSYEALYGFRGVFTLKSSVKISSGKGTSDEPYVLN